MTFGRTLFVVISFFSVALFLAYSFRYSNKLTHGFAAYYGFSRLLTEGENPAHAYDHGYFHSKLAEFEFGRVRDIVNNLPTNALVFVPLTPLSPRPAKIVWTVLSLLLYGFALRMLLQANDIVWNDTLGLAVISLACLWRPSYENIAHGQMYFLLLFCFSLSLCGIVRNKLLTQSIPIAGSILAKGYGVICAMWFLFHRRPQVTFITALTVTLLVLLTLPFFGLGTWMTYYKWVVTDFGALPASGHVTYQTLNSLLLHLFSYDSQWSPAPIISLPGDIVRLIIFFTSIALTVCVLVLQRSGRREKAVISFSAILATSVVVAPQAAEYHYVLLLPTTISLLRYLGRMEDGLARFGLLKILVAVAVIILAVPMKYKWLNGADFPIYLFAYPKLYAGLVLIGCSLFLTSANTMKTEDVVRDSSSLQ